MSEKTTSQRLKVKFEDHGQDFRHWIIELDKDNPEWGIVVQSFPFQNIFWRNSIVSIKSCIERRFLEYSKDGIQVWKLNYPIEEIKEFTSDEVYSKKIVFEVGGIPSRVVDKPILEDCGCPEFQPMENFQLQQHCADRVKAAISSLNKEIATAEKKGLTVDVVVNQVSIASMDRLNVAIKLVKDF